jgi:hypothetical protein
MLPPEKKHRSTGTSPAGAKNLDGWGSVLVLQTSSHAGKPRGDYQKRNFKTRKRG